MPRARLEGRRRLPHHPPAQDPLSHLRRPIALTRLSLALEGGARVFWPALTWGALVWAASLARLPDMLAPLMSRGLWLWLLGVVWGVFAALAAWGLWRWRWPSAGEAVARLDAALPNRPIAALLDAQAMGTQDPASRALWEAHQKRMREGSYAAKPPRPAPALARRDPYGLRLMALLALVVAVLFGPPAPRPEAAGPLNAAHSATASWEGWISPPAYSGLPNLYLSDQPAGELALLKGSRITLRFYGEGLDLHETVGEPAPDATDTPPAGGPEIRQITVARPGRLEITGAGDTGWDITLTPDAPPTVAYAGEMDVAASGEVAQDFTATDDVAVTDVRAVITLDLAAVPRRYGLAPDPMARPPLEVALPLPFAGSRNDFTGRMVEDFSLHPFANLPVKMVLVARDGADQEGRTDTISFRLPGRRFFQPVAKAVIEQRRDLLWNHANAPRVLDLLRAIANRPEDLHIPRGTVAQMRAAIAQLGPLAARIAADPRAVLTAEEEETVATALWELALQLEEGDLEDARARLARAQERLNEAMRNGASPEEIAELMQELRDATDAYLDLLAQSAEPPEDRTDQPDRGPDNSREITQDQIQQLMDRIQELMEEGRMEEAQQLMRELDELLRNLQMQQAEGQGNDPRRPGQEQMEELQDTLRDQQELADEAFRNLQDQFNGRSQPQNGQEGGQPQGQQQGPEGQPQGQDDQTQEGTSPQDGGEEEGTGPSPEGEESAQENGGGEDPQAGMADRQESLRRELERQRAQLPGLTGEAAQRARDALRAAEEAMDQAEEALRRGDLAGAIDNQAQALNALREGLRALDEAFAANDPEADDMLQEGTAEGEGGQRREPARNDPLGRQQGQAGEFGTDQNMLDGLDPRQRATELLEELRRRAGERGRDESELDYLRRLLDQF